MTLLAPTGERMSFYKAARQYDQEALRVIASVFMDEKQPAALRLAATNDLLDRAYGRPPVAIDATTREMSLKKIIHEVRWPSKRTTVNGEQLRSFNWILPNRLPNSLFRIALATRGNPGPTDRP